MKLYKNIIIVSVILVFLAGGLVLVKNLPEKEGVNTKTENSQAVEYIDVFRAESSDILNIQVTTKTGSYTVSNDKNGVSLSDSSNIKINKQTLQSFVNTCSYIYAEKIATEKADDISLYGFSEPTATIMINLNDGTEKVVHIGNKTVDGSGCYLMISGDEKVYIKSAYGISNLAPEYTAFIDKNVMTINPTKYESLSNISIKKSGNKDIELKSVTETNGNTKNTYWKMVKPIHADANGVILSNDILTPLESFKASGIVEAKPKDLSKYDLINPYATLTISAVGATQTLKFGKEAEGYRFFMVDNYATVYMAPADSLSFIDVAYIDLMSRLVHTENIKYISTVDIKTPDKNFNLKILNNEYFINDKKIEKDAFTKIYRDVISISFDSVDLNAKPSASSEISIKYTRNDGSTCMVSYVSINERNYLALVDGKGNGIVTKKSVREVVESINKSLTK